MTEQTQPTDAELEACPFCGNANTIVYDDLLTFHAGCLSCGATGSVSSYRNGAIAAWNRRAVLEKLGTPAGAGEPTEAMIDAGNRARLYREHGDLREEAVLSARTHNTRATWFAMCEAAPQPTQAQAGAVPLTDEQAKEAVRLLRGFLDCPFVLDEATCSSLGLEETMRRNPRQVVVNMSCALLRIREARALIASVDAAHGVADMKGGQDGVNT